MASGSAPLTLICAATGSALSLSLAQLDRRGVSVVDLEKEICQLYVGDSRLALRPNEAPRMEAVARRPRKELHERWRQSLNASASKLGSSPTAIGMHLSWYNSSTSEFFSPVSVVSLSNLAVSRVVVLIDDIYDMFDRLQGKYDIYGSNVLTTHRMQLSKFAYSGPFQNDQDARIVEEGLGALTIENALSHLLSWRRSEMVQAENIATVLDCELTLLGVKHSSDALAALVNDPGSPTIYLSHRITEPRRMNLKSASLPGDLGQWPPLCDEVNILHSSFAGAGQVLINPTAIDELRFPRPLTPSEHPPFLAARWPIPQPTDSLLWRPVEDYNHTKLLAGANSGNPITSGVVRSLIGRIYFEIAFRDHYIVEHTPHLLIFRPFFCENSENPEKDADWSGGVGPELRHWLSKTAVQPDETISTPSRLAVVHTDIEVRDRLIWLKNPSHFESHFTESVRSHFFAKLKKEAFPDEEIESLRRGAVAVQEATHLDLNQLQFTQRRAGDVLEWVGIYSLASLFHVFSGMKRPAGQDDNKGHTDVALLVRHEASDRRLEGLVDLVDPLTSFYSGHRSGATLSASFWSHVQAEFLNIFGKSISAAGFEAVRLSPQDLEALP
jgi:hypothetical protein